MAQQTEIEWTDATWNPVTGCTRIGPGCDNCYALRFAERWRGIPEHPYEQGFDLRLWPERIDIPLKWRRPRMIFVNSMSDLFHKTVPADFVDSVFDTMERASHHTYQVLTKRSSLMRNYVRRRYEERPVPGHIWLGTSIENRSRLNRLNHLRQMPARVRFVSFEPLLGEIGAVDLSGIAWAIVGGESGPGARPMHPDWARALRDACRNQGVAFFFKQWGGRNPKSGGRLLDGRTWDGFPTWEKHAA
ncbi:MAG: phage Gp37/Gp68 family protein [Alphaproteobacteria bacterium]|nr:phage Gp37/Gp68 family protein [Alphaproteobacteria bacterium]